MKKIIFTFSLVLSGAAIAFAQTGGSSSASYCNPLYPGQNLPENSAAVSVRIVNPDSAEVNVKAVFDIPSQITPVNLGLFESWDPQSRKLGIELGTFQTHETKQLILDFQGSPVACVVYGTLSGEWSPKPVAGPSTWQSQINFSALIPSFGPVTTGGGGVSPTSIVDTVRIDPQVQSAATPAAVTAGALGALAASAGFPWWNLLHLFNLASIGSLKRKPQKPWGVVFDKATKQPITDATVKVYDAVTNRLKDSALTDIDGRFGFLVPAGAYYLHVTRPGFDEYQSPFVDVSDKAEEKLNIEVPLEGKSVKHALFGRVIGWLRDVLDYLSPFILIVGTLVSAVVVVLFPKLLHYIVLGLYLILDILKIILDSIVTRSFGSVVDKDTKLPLSLAVVRVYEVHHGTLLATRVTNPEGKFKFLVTPGEYYITCARDGYISYTSPQMNFRRSDLIKLDIPLEHASA